MRANCIDTLLCLCQFILETGVIYRDFHHWEKLYHHKSRVKNNCVNFSGV